MKKFFHLLPFLFVLNSCGLIIVNGFSDDYNNLKEQHKAMIVSFKPNQPVEKTAFLLLIQLNYALK
ncbi:hypothetical protein MG290_08915 [Flavobacterium sp. CBA20B-1]|uniref:hypothetical protein n=1 Tax=unclassified Flavobacterium TaxID=196869 RepID=UPI002224D2A5|nr:MULTISPECIES: hypothetical protein [unclassified Flavobacterium]WCM41076.1 hypothetical protein MG290_08915 [Flavobacterium sp. CBA20B-1]